METWFAISATLLAIAVALDQIAKKDAKLAFRDMLIDIKDNVQPARLLENLIDHTFGKRLLSLRSFIISVIFSTLSVGLMIVCVFLINGVSAYAVISAGFYWSSGLAATLLTICFMIVAMGDYVSLCQTRLFMRTVNLLRNKYATIVMVIADVATSVIIFIIFMSVARLVCYVTIANAIRNNPPSIERQVYPDSIIAIYDEVLSHSKRSVNDNRNAETVINLIRFGRSDKRSLNQLSTFLRQKELGTEGFGSSIVYQLTWGCSKFKTIQNIPPYEFSNSIVSSHSTAVYALMDSVEKFPKEYDQNRIGQIGALAAASAFRADKKCPLQTIDWKVSIYPHNLLKEVSLTDAFLSSLSLTMNETLRSVAIKFSGYDAITPESDFGTFLSNAVLSRSLTFLGAGDPSQTHIVITDFLSNLNGRTLIQGFDLRIPITTLSASSMMPSIIFALFIILRWSAFVWDGIASITGTVYKRYIQEKFIFTYTSVVIFFAGVATIISGIVLDKMWTLIFI